MLGAHAIEVGPLGMLAINISLLALVGWALLRAERGLPDGREWTLLAMLAISKALASRRNHNSSCACSEPSISG